MQANNSKQKGNTVSQKKASPENILYTRVDGPWIRAVNPSTDPQHTMPFSMSAEVKMLQWLCKLRSV